jgi:tryptophan synthase beta chain
MSDEKTVKFLLPESEIPTHWVNLLPDLPGDPLPPLNPGTMQPAGPEDLTPIFPMGLIQQEVSMDPEIEIPDAVRDAYRIYRPSPLYRAHRLEKALDTPAHIYFKYEGVSPAGSHKPNSAIPQAYENKQAGIDSLATETGAGQWGSALALACSLFDMQCEVFMVGASYDQKPYRRAMMEAWGATVHRSPSDLTDAGRSQQAHPTGSLGIAISEAVEVAAKDPATNYALGSVLNHVCLHQTVIGQEAMAQMAMAGEEPDVVVGCVGGGSNFAGLSFPFVRRVLRGEAKTRFLAAEPAACPTLTRGAYRYDFGDTVGMTPLLPMYTLGHDFVPPPVHAGGLRYHGDAPMLCGLVHHGVVEARAYKQNDAFGAAVQFARTEGIIPGPEPAHAIRATVDEAVSAREAGESRVILLGLSGHGHFDMSAYDAYLSGSLEDIEFSEQEMEDALARLPEAPALA